MPKALTDDDVATHDNTLEPDPDPIVNGDDAENPPELPIERDDIIADDEDEIDEEDDDDLVGGG